MDERTPNFFIIGAPKAGTTFVHHALGLVPEVYMSAVKEPGYFTSARDQARGLDYYLDAYFARAAGHPLRGESTPWYLYSSVALDRIAAMSSTTPPRFLVLVRRPSDRALSMYRDQVRIKREHRGFAQAIGDELDQLASGKGGGDIRRRYVWCSQYAAHIERWQHAFGADRVHVAVFEDLADAPEQLWRELEAFLGTDLGRPRFDEVSDRDRNPAGSLRWPRLDQALRSMEGGENVAIERAKRVLPPGLHRRVLQQVGRLNRTAGPVEPVVVDPETRQRIDDACGASTRQVEALLGRELPGWTAGPPAADA